VSGTTADDVRPRLMGDALRRYWVLILLCAAGLGFVGSLAAKAQPVSYTASAKVLLRPTLGNPLGSDTGASGQQVTIAMETEATLVDSNSVATISNKRLTAKWTAGSGRVKATVPPNTQILLITFSAAKAKDAQAGAQAVATGYLTYRQDQSAVTEKSRTTALGKQISSASDKLDEAAKDQASTDTTTAANAQRQVQLLTDQLVSLQDALSKLQATDTAPGSVLSPAQLPGKAGGIDARIIIGAAAGLGLGLGLVLAIARTRADKRLRRSVLVVGNVPVLSVLGPRRGLLGRLLSGRLLRRLPRRRPERPGRGLRSSYQRLRTGVLAAASSSSTVAVSDTGQTGTVGDVVQELGGSFVRAGYRVVVVIAGPDEVATRIFEVADLPGLSDLLPAEDPVSPLLVERDGLRVLPPGADIDERQERLSGSRFVDILTELSAEADYVLVVAPVATSPSGIAVGRVASGMLLVGRELRTTSTDVEDVVDRAELVGAHVIGLALRAKGYPAVPGIEPPADLAGPGQGSGDGGPAVASPEAAGSGRSGSGDAALGDAGAGAPSSAARSGATRSAGAGPGPVSSGKVDSGPVSSGKAESDRSAAGRGNQERAGGRPVRADLLPGADDQDRAAAAERDQRSAAGRQQPAAATRPGA
jgi:polysaccharide biosynthesis transport protein